MRDELLFLPDAVAPEQLYINGKAVHSRHPDQEAKRQVAEILSRSPRSVILLAPGLGFVIDLLLEQSEARLLWIEPDERIQQAVLRRISKKLVAFHRHHLDDLTIYSDDTSERLILCSSFPEFNRLRSLLVGTPDTWHIFTLRATFHPRYVSFLADLEQRSFRETVNRNTLKRFDRIWLKNLYYNLVSASQWYAVSSLFQKHRNQPGVVVSAGPSLDRCIPALIENRSRFILIAVDTAVNTLQHYGLDPDYLLSVDAQAANFFHIRPYRGQATLVVDMTVSYLTLRHHKGPYFTFHNPLPAASVILQMLFPDGAGEIQFGGSVSTNAFDFAIKLGCAPIYLCGLDLSFPGYRIHARGSALEEAALTKTHRLHTAHQQNHSQLTAVDRRYLKNRAGRAVPTNDKLLIFYDWFRSRITGGLSAHPEKSNRDGKADRDSMPAASVIHVDGGGAYFSSVRSITQDLLATELRQHPVISFRNRTTGHPAAADSGEILKRIDSALIDVENLLAEVHFPEGFKEHCRAGQSELSPASLAERLLQIDQRHGFPVIRLLSSGMQNRLLSSDGLIQDGIKPAELFNDLRDSLHLHRRLISKCRQFTDG
jgi:hypothetical protein